MFSYKSKYCVAAAVAAMAALTGHVEARDIDLQRIHCCYRIALNM